MKNVAMIPARLGSKRVHDKNLRLIGGKPLVAYIVEAVIESDVFALDDIYLNSESDIIKNIADDYGIKFYKRPSEFSTDTASNDGWVLDFISKVDCDMVFQFLATSPFTSPQDIRDFFNKAIETKCDTLISTNDVRIECLYDGNPINFIQKEQTPPSQSLIPIKAYACGLMAWSCDNFRKNMKKYNSGYHGGDGKIEFFDVKGFAAVDIDTEDDFVLAERVLEALSRPAPDEVKYYDPKLHSGVTRERDVPNILQKDGVEDDNYIEPNQMVVNLDEISSRYTDDSWVHRLVNTESNCCHIIHQRPGEGNRKHYHPAWNEWWYILKGEWDFEIENNIYRVKKGDLVFIPKNKWHKITCVGKTPAARLAVSRADVEHVYKNQ